MRLLSVLAMSLCLASALEAQVRISVKKDGSKVIYNIPGSGGKDGGNYTWLARQHDRRTQYDSIIERHALRYGVDPVLVRAVIQVESNFDPNCVSPKGARGLMQLMPGTAARFGVKKLHDPEENIRGGVAYLAVLLKMFDELPHALAAYNAGEGAVQRYKGIPPYQETSNYVRRAMTVYYGRPYGGGGGSMMFAAGRGKAALSGGFGRGAVAPVAAAMFPGARYLGSH